MNLKNHLLIGSAFFLLFCVFLLFILRNCFWQFIGNKFPILDNFPSENCRFLVYSFASLTNIERQGLLKITYENPVLLFTVGACVALYGSVLPDIDTVKSKIFIPTVLSFSLLCIYGFYTNSMYITRLSLLLILLVIAFLLLGHRRITHKWPAVLIYGIITGFAFVNLYIGFFGSVGYGSHLVSDKISTLKKRLLRI